MSILIVLIILIASAHYLRWRASPSYTDALLEHAHEQEADDGD